MKLTARSVIVTIVAVTVLTVGVMVIFDPFHLIHINRPYEPDKPVPQNHEGTFVNEHGFMKFKGDGKTVVIGFDDELAALTGLPADSHIASYRFLSGDLPPHGSVEVRYDNAHELEITVEGTTVVLELGIAEEDGSKARSGVDTVTEDMIPLLFEGENGFFTIIFIKFN